MEFNLAVKTRKDDFQREETASKVKEHEEALAEFHIQKTDIEKDRLNHQANLEIRKIEIRETLYRMHVWNCWDEKVLDLVFKRPTGTSIDAVVRKFAS